jgi:Fe-S-cluster containining protein
MDYTGFMQTYCRWVSRWDAGQGRECLSLKEKSNFDCVFWNQGCTVYRARPAQCRTFPFWPVVLGSPEAWEIAATGCPGMNTGKLYSRSEIEERLAEEKAAQADLIYRDSFIAGGITGEAVDAH